MPPVGPYTPIVRAGDFLFCSGQIGLTESGLSEVFSDQVKAAIANLAKLLDETGASLGDVVKTTVFLSNMDNYSEMNTAYMEAFGDHRPARSAIGVGALPLGALVEIEAIAYRPE